MKKFRLDPDQLTVESFTSTNTKPERGTVHGRGDTVTCVFYTCAETCDYCTATSCSADHNCLCQVPPGC